MSALSESLFGVASTGKKWGPKTFEKSGGRRKRGFFNDATLAHLFPASATSATPQKPSKAGVHMAKYLTPTPQKPSKLGMSLSNAVTMRKSSAGSYTAPSSSGTIKTSKRSATG